MINSPQECPPVSALRDGSLHCPPDDAIALVVFIFDQWSAIACFAEENISGYQERCQ